MTYVYETVTEDALQSLTKEWEEWKAIDVLKWTYDTYGEEVVYASSLGAEGMVLLHLIQQVNPSATVVFIDTDYHFSETYRFLEEVKNYFSTLNIQNIQPELTPAEQKTRYGDKLWEKDPDQCCAIRKLAPLEKELTKYEAWISGLRREQSPTRQHVQFVNKDNRFRKIKICPLIHWTWDEVWDYINTHSLPYHPLHDQNYPSIGCFPCTAPVLEGEDLRSGRWQGLGKTECGLHRP